MTKTYSNYLVYNTPLFGSNSLYEFIPNTTRDSCYVFDNRYKLNQITL